MCCVVVNWVLRGDFHQLDLKEAVKIREPSLRVCLAREQTHKIEMSTWFIEPESGSSRSRNSGTRKRLLIFIARAPLDSKLS